MTQRTHTLTATVNATNNAGTILPSLPPLNYRAFSLASPVGRERIPAQPRSATHRRPSKTADSTAR
jgi:hypothetical protein